MIKIIALVLPLSLDTFAVSAAVAVGGLSSRERVRISLLFAAFEGGMPLAGLGLGRAVGSAIGSTADFVAIAVLVALGIYMLREDGGEQQEGFRVDRGILATVALGISVSLDELAIGLTLGLLRLPLLPVIAAIALQAFLAAQLGMRLGERIGEHLREGAERVAGGALTLLGVGLLAERLLA